jgi:C-terminal processing protease CtpA/Prc
MFFQVIVTVSEKLLSSPDKLKAIDACGDCIYRINGAHISGAGLDKFTDELRGILGEPRILLDLPGNKIRIKGLSDPMPL